MTLARDVARALDPLEFAIDCGIDPDPWQRDLLCAEPHKALLLCSRQSGKSTSTALIGLHEAIYAAPSLILLVSPALRQSQELFRKVLDFHRVLSGAPEIAQESALRVEFKNGSRIIALPGSEATIRGYSAARLVIIDEASRVEDSVLGAIRPTLATSNGRMIALTTPAGKRGWFYEQWIGGGGWYRTKLTAHDCPRISAEFLENERRELGEFVFSQEYLCEFVDDQTQVFPTELIDRAFRDDVAPLFGGPSCN